MADWDVIAKQRAKYKWTMGYLPSFSGEGAIYGRYIAKHLKGTTIGVLIGWQFLAAPLLANASLLGAARQALFPGALNRLAPIGVADQGAPLIVHSVVVAVVVLVGWTAIALGMGAWRTATRPA